MKPGKVTVVGGGLAGGLISIMLARSGWRVTLLERRADPRQATFRSRRTINLALSTRGRTALASVGLEDRVLSQSVAMHGRQVHCLGAEERFIAYSSNPANAIYSIRRDLLNQILIDEASREQGIDIRFGARCVDISPQSGRVDYELIGGGSACLESDLIIGADGLWSFVREVVSAHEPGCSVEVSTFSHGYKELTISAPSAQAAQLRTDALHVWPRGSALIVALPNPNKSFNCTLFWNLKGHDSFARRDNPVALEDALQNDYPDLIPLLDDLTDQYADTPASPLRSIRCSAWETAGRVLVIGDAAHAQLPFFGQGMNTAFEDCSILTQLLHECDTQEQALKTFVEQRRPNTDAIAALSERNFRELSQDVADPNFRFSQGPKEHSHSTGTQTLYEQVTFSNRPYAEIVREFEVR